MRFGLAWTPARSLTADAYLEQTIPTPPPNIDAKSITTVNELKLLLLVEEHAEADDGSVDKEAAQNRHDHGFDADEV